MTTTPSRADVTFGVLDGYWRTTSQIADRLYAAGFTWGANTTRAVLQALHEVGKAERQLVGNGYRWRRPAATAEPRPATIDDLGSVADRIADIARQVADMTVIQPSPPPPAKAVTVGDECDLADLTEAQEYLVRRIVKRAVYDTGRALLDVLEGWIEGAAGNHEALGHRDADCCSMFHPDDVRRMVNDACRVMGAPEAWHA